MRALVDVGKACLGECVDQIRGAFLAVIFGQLIVLPALAEDLPLETWTDHAGRTMRAALKDSNTNQVILITEGGTTKRVPIANLSEKSRLRVAALQKQRQRDEGVKFIAKMQDPTDVGAELTKSLRRLEAKTREKRVTEMRTRTILEMVPVNEMCTYTVNVPRTIRECVCVNGRWVWRTRTVMVQEQRTQTVTTMQTQERQENYSVEVVQSTFIPSPEDPQDIPLLLEKPDAVDLGAIPASAAPTLDKIRGVLVNQSQPAYLPPESDPESPDTLQALSDWTAFSSAPGRLMRLMLASKPVGNDVHLRLIAFQIDSSADQANLSRGDFLPSDAQLQQFLDNALAALRSGLTQPVN